MQRKENKLLCLLTKWGLRDNVVLRQMECLTPTVISFDLFMDNYLMSFHLSFCLGVIQKVCSLRGGGRGSLKSEQKHTGGGVRVLAFVYVCFF